MLGSTPAAAEDALAGRIGEIHTRRRALAVRRQEVERRIAALDRTIEARRIRREPDTRAVVVELAPDIDVVGTATYRPARRVAVAADGASHRSAIAAIELDAVLDYLIVPKVSPDAYLWATVTNTSPHTLLPGKVSIFHGGDYVGSGAIETVPPGAEVELQLGVDDRVRVERELVRRSAGRRAVGNTRRTDVAYRIDVANHTPRVVRATVKDQVPVSRHDSVQVRDVQARPAPTERSDLGLLSWTLSVAPGTSGQVEFSFRLEQPKGVELTGWRD